MRLLLLSVLALFAAAPGARAWDSPAPDVVLYCLPTLKTQCAALAAAFRSASGVEVHLFLAPPAGLAGLFLHRARADVVVADTPTLQSLAAAHLVNTGTITALGTDAYVLAGQDAANKADLAALLAAHPVILTDPTTAASFDGHAILTAALGQITPPKEIGAPDTPYVLADLHSDDSAIALVTNTDARGAKIPVLAKLDVPPMPISGAIVTLRQSVNSPHLLAFIAGPQGAAIRRAGGLEPAP